MGINAKKLIFNMRSAVFAQALAFSVSAVMSLLVPKMLGVEEYAYWQLFLLYGAYVPLFHLGLNDGVYLINGGKTFTEMNRRSLMGQFFVGLIVEVSIAILVFVWTVVNFEGSRLFVFGLIAIYIVLFNIGSYWGAVCQAANETHYYSKMQTIDKACFFVLLLIGITCSITCCEYYVVAYVISRFIAGCYIVLKCRYFFGQSVKLLKSVFRESACSIRVGIKLTISYLASIFILGAPRMIADGAWSIEQFAQLSFAISLMNFLVVFVNQVGMVLFPALRRVTEVEFGEIYRKLTLGLDLLLPVVYVLYYPILIAVQWWLPQYSEGLQWLSTMLPVCVYNSRMEILSSTALKVLRKEAVLMKINLIAAGFAAMLAGACGLFEMEHRVLILMIVFVTTGRSIVSELYVSGTVIQANTASVATTVVFAAQYLLVVMFVSVEVATVVTALLWLALLVTNKESIRSIILKSKAFNE